MFEIVGKTFDFQFGGPSEVMVEVAGVSQRLFYTSRVLLLLSSLSNS